MKRTLKVALIAAMLIVALSLCAQAEMRSGQPTIVGFEAAGYALFN